MTGTRLGDGLAWLLLAAAAVVFARHCAAALPFTVDDAYIFFRYARNLADGNGLTFNAGQPPVEGITSLAWPVLLAVPLALGLDAVVSSKVLGIAATILAAVAIHRSGVGCARAAGLPPVAGRLAGGFAVLVFVSLPATALHAVSGMCTALFTAVCAWLLQACQACIESPGRGPRRRFAVLALAAGVARPEGNLIAATAIAGAWLSLPRPARALLLREVLVLYVLPGAVVFASRWLYYGLPLPLPFYVKMAARSEFAELGEPSAAMAMLGALGPTWLPLLALGALSWRRSFAVCVVAAAAHLLAQLAPRQIMGYGWRFLYPALPVLAVGVGFGLLALALWLRRRAAPWGAVVAVVAGAATVAASLRAGADDVEFFSTRYSASLRGAHEALGRHLAELPVNGTPLLAIGDAGAAPFTAGWQTLDTYGLNEPAIAVSGRHDAEAILARRPDVLVVMSRHAYHFDPLLAWERPILDVARARGYAVAGSLWFEAAYHLWLLAPEGAPTAAALRAWQPETALPDPFGVRGAATPPSAAGEHVPLARRYRGFTLVDALVCRRCVAIRLRVDERLAGRYRFFVRTDAPAGAGGRLRAQEFAFEPPLPTLQPGSERVYVFAAEPPLAAGEPLRIGLLDPEPPYPFHLDADGRDHVAVRVPPDAAGDGR